MILWLAVFCNLMAKKEGNTEATRMIHQFFDDASCMQSEPLLALCTQ